ncbi:hypothetical protein CWI42_080780 [Ordospora colligata]|uniref:Uncharacterized protein n=1 Tax=Ordospora colligata OC4 TaxID=1354746 RepID=A0A0B2UJ38_9MICR|nr:uncharacterized protein M896_080780 [Ordospora colligata OC4]KHN69343.1 hypothetical protein M896_080780 [Ordospora colligata OC4]TBU14857.1 hypothetical protein CWI41_080770 [Ordospora colligata]TBU14988.1 hypothetical protein CWI40_080790 [Ordospora colligata]TBU18242.1 hypothetical protein CWI42_080780 [Ordospora colligata]
MAFLDNITQYVNTIKKHNSVLRTVLTCIPLLLLLSTNKSNSISSKEMVQEYLNGKNSAEIPESCDFKSFDASKRFILNNLPPRQTLRIQAYAEYEKNYCQIVSALKMMNISNINVVVDFNMPDERCEYLFDIDLRFSKIMHMAVYPLRNHQPNSDLLLVAEVFFPSSIVFSMKDVLFPNTPANRLEIHIRTTRRDMRQFMNFVRSISFVRTHPYGSYFYVPIGGSYINGTAFISLVMPIIVYFVLDWTCMAYEVSCTRILLGSVLYYISPMFLVLFVRRNESMCLCAIFMVLNPKIGMIYALVCYTRMVHDVYTLGFRHLKSVNMLKPLK